MKAATFNVNSINARMESLSSFLAEEKPDIVLLQEIKTEFEKFPFFELKTLGYEAKILGQKSYNGVAVLSPYKMEIVQENLPNFPDENARYLEVEVYINDKPVRAASIYVPNGNPPYNAPNDDSKFIYKLKFMDCLYAHMQDILSRRENFFVAGDFNVIFSEVDVYNPEHFRQNALFRTEVRERFSALTYLGLCDAFRAINQKENGYTYWDYSGGALAADLGMRIDYFLLSPLMTDKLRACRVSKKTRSLSRPSDHAPLIAEFEGL